MERKRIEDTEGIYEYLWEPDGAGGARLLGMYGQTPDALVPEFLAGLPVTEIGDYCFAGRRSAAPDSEPLDGQRTDAASLRKLAGDTVESVILPQTIRRIGSYAFYQCRQLKELTLGDAVDAVGGDAFMNCHRLHRMTVSGEAPAAGIRQILAQISSDMEVDFVRGEEVRIRLLFPEYYESYDEIAPAHLFGRNIEGEGFRARQCLRQGEIDFALYDSIFPKACAEEREATLNRLACDRLRYPVGLAAESQERYEAYIRAHADALCAEAVGARDEDAVQFLCEQGLLGSLHIDGCIRLAADAEWAKGVAAFLRMKEQFFAEKTVEERYTFDDF